MKLMKADLIGRYKSLRDQTFSFNENADNITALIGLNGSGKSQLLELLAESFAHIERAKREDFKARTSLPFSIEITYKLHNLKISEHEKTYKFKLCKSGEIGCHSLINSTWHSILITEIDLPEHIIGYSSGLNENLQRSFMKNAIQYYDAMSIKGSWIKKLDNINNQIIKKGKYITSEELEIFEKTTEDAYKYYYTRHPGIFEEPSKKAKLSDDLQIGARPTKIPSTLFLDYDCNAILVFCLTLLDRNEIDELFGEELPYRYPAKVIITYDLREFAYDSDAIRDIKQLISASPKTINPISNKTPDSFYDQHELDYLAANISLDLTDDSVTKKLKEQYFGDPKIIFEKLFKIQLLGAKAWQQKDKISLRKDDFFGNVKKPLKTKLPLSITKLTLSNNKGELVDFDDLSDGESQQAHILTAIRVFRHAETLFLLDEPETHLNPSWRTQFHQHLKKSIASQKQNNIEPEIILTTHSPFMISSLDQQNVFNFERSRDGMTTMQTVSSQTFGASFEVIAQRYYGLKSLISNSAIQEIKKHLDNQDSEETRQWIESNIGDSMEKAYLLKKLEK
jgi:predicted ATPase